MNIVETYILGKVDKLLVELDEVSEELSDNMERKQTSHKISDMTTDPTFDKDLLAKSGRIQLKLILLKGLL